MGRPASSSRFRRGAGGNASVVDARTLGALGLGPQEELVYRTLLVADGATAAELAKRMKAKPVGVRRTLARLAEKGMITHAPEAEHQYFAIPPDIAVEALIVRRQSLLDEDAKSARVAIVEMQKATASRQATGRETNRIVEILSREAAGEVYSPMRRAAREEVLCIERLPVLATGGVYPDEELLQCLRRGVRCRTLSDSSLLQARRGHLEGMRRSMEAGEEFRIAPDMPFKLVVVDRRTAIIPLDLSRPDGSVLLVRTSSLLDALCRIFDLLWASATPFQSVASSVASARSADESADRLIELLASGFNDKAIEQELGMSFRTLTRRIAQLMKKLGAVTRFQAGWLAAQAATRRGAG